MAGATADFGFRGLPRFFLAGDSSSPFVALARTLEVVLLLLTDPDGRPSEEISGAAFEVEAELTALRAS